MAVWLKGLRQGRIKYMRKKVQGLTILIINKYIIIVAFIFLFSPFIVTLKNDGEFIDL